MKSSLTRPYAPVADRGRCLQGARCRRADRDDAAFLVEAAVDGRRGAGRDLEGLGIDLVLLDLLDPHGLERAVAHVQGDLGAPDPARVE